MIGPGNTDRVLCLLGKKPHHWPDLPQALRSSSRCLTATKSYRHAYHDLTCRGLVESLKCCTRLRRTGSARQKAEPPDLSVFSKAAGGIFTLLVYEEARKRIMDRLLPSCNLTAKCGTTAGFWFDCPSQIPIARHGQFLEHRVL
jgi:hypothetical protein